jgi:hypothetical protein
VPMNSPVSLEQTTDAGAIVLFKDVPPSKVLGGVELSPAKARTTKRETTTAFLDYSLDGALS